MSLVSPPLPFAFFGPPRFLPLLLAPLFLETIHGSQQAWLTRHVFSTGTYPGRLFSGPSCRLYKPPLGPRLHCSFINHQSLSLKVTFTFISHSFCTRSILDPFLSLSIRPFIYKLHPHSLSKTQDFQSLHFKMMFTKTIGLAAAFASLASALPSAVVRRDTTASSGEVLITNTLDKDVYAWSVADQAGPMQTISANGGTFTEKYRTNSNGGGISIKLATDQDQSDVLQFEYTQASNTIFWDLSCINMDTDSVFKKYGFSVEPTDNGGDDKSCPTASCKANDDSCQEAYLKPTDDHATHGCPIDTGLTVTIGHS